MIRNTKAYELYEEMLKTSVKSQMYKGCSAAVNVPFVNAVFAFGLSGAPDPFEEGSPASNHYHDLRYFLQHADGDSGCPFKLNCTTAAMKMLHDNDMVNPYEPEEVVEEVSYEELKETAEAAAEAEDIASGTYVPVVEKNDPPEELFGVVPEKRTPWNRRKKRR